MSIPFCDIFTMGCATYLLHKYELVIYQCKSLGYSYFLLLTKKPHSISGTTIFYYDCDGDVARIRFLLPNSQTSVNGGLYH